MKIDMLISPLCAVNRCDRRWCFAVLLALCLWGRSAQLALATTITVSTTGDSGAGSLRQAIHLAAPNDTITFAADLSGAHIMLTSAPLLITKTLTIDGTALPVALTIDGNEGRQLFTVNSSGTLTLTQLTLANGNGNYGGALYNSGRLILDRVTLHNNRALGGGAIYNVGSLTLQNSTLSGNQAFSGGAIDNYGTLVIKNSTFSGNDANNTGGALFNAGTLYLYNAILANSSRGGDCLNANEAFFGLVGVIAANVNNLIEDAGCSATVSGDPKLLPLALVDGVLVHGLAADSPAIDAGDLTSCLPIDQRGLLRPQGAGCDLGAWEMSSEINTNDSVTQTSFSARFTAAPQPCATSAFTALPRHTITPTMQNKGVVGYRDLYLVVTELGYTADQADNIPTLCNGDQGGGVGTRLTIPLIDNLADNLLAPEETFTQALVVGLPVRARYRLAFDLYGVATDATAVAAKRAPPAQRIGRLSWEFDPERDLIDHASRLFLPLVAR